MNGKAAAVTLCIAWTLGLTLAGCSGASGASPSATAPAAGGGIPSPGSAAGGTSSPAGSAPVVQGGGSGSNKASSSSDVIKFPPGGAASVVAWYHGQGGKEFNSLTTTLGNATQAKAKGGVTAFAKSCGQIRSVALAAEAAPPMPLASVAKVYSSALAEYVTAATKCEEASTAGNSASLRSAVGEVESNGVTLNRAAAVLIAALSRG